VFVKTLQIVLGMQRPDDSVRAPKVQESDIRSDKEIGE